MPKLELNRTIKKSQRGAVIVLFALLLPVLFGFMGLGIDVGLAYLEKGKVQDIADAAALAGAAKLSANGSNDMNAIKVAVKSYVEANGIALDENDMLLKEANKWDDKETLAKDKDALVAYGVVSVTNSEGVAVDRVRVRVNKRVPTFFVNVLGHFSDGFVVVAKAAAEGMGEEVQLTAEGPGFIAFENLHFLTTNIHDRKDNGNAKGYGSDIYAGKRITVDGNGNSKLMLAGNYYAPDECNGIKLKNDDNTDDYKFFDIDYNPSDATEAVKNEISKLANECSNMLLKTDSQNYKVVTSCSLEGEEGNRVAVINNNVLGASTKIDNLVINIKNADLVVLNTNGITFGNVYIDGTAYIEGANNMFTGRLYSSDELNIFGNNNTYTQMISKTVNVGKGYYEHGNGKFSSSFNNIKKPFTEDVGTGSSGSGNSNNSITTGNLRLVE